MSSNTRSINPKKIIQGTKHFIALLRVQKFLGMFLLSRFSKAGLINPIVKFIRHTLIIMPISVIAIFVGDQILCDKPFCLLQQYYMKEDNL